MKNVNSKSILEAPVTGQGNEYWGRHARRYDRATQFLNRRVLEMAGAVADTVGHAQNVLEIAAGTGLVTEAAAPRAQRFVATDSSHEMLELLRHRMSGTSNIEVRAVDALSLDFADNAFDVVIIANLLHLLDDPVRALSEAHRVLKPGGKLVVPTFAHGEGWVANVVSRILGLSGFPVVTRFRDQQLDTLVSESGFEVVDARWFSGLLPIRFVAARAV